MNIFGTSGKMHSHPLSFKARASIEHCIAKVSIGIDCPPPALYFDSILSDTVSLNLSIRIV